MINIGGNIKALRNMKGLTLEEMANELNSKYPGEINFNKGKISKWENGKDRPLLSSAAILADYFEISIDDLISKDVNLTTDETHIDNIFYTDTIRNIIDVSMKLSDFRQENVYSYAEYQLEEQNNTESIQEQSIIYGRSTAAGTARFVDDADAYEVRPDSIVPKGADELVEVVGDSMEPLIHNGDKVYIRHQPTVEQGEVAIVRIENEGVTCKRVYIDEDTITLKSENKKYDDMKFSPSQISVLGKVLL
ncbi:multidrug transporter [Suicoccus acidiformans]|uniref:Multidrug transporter n=1 Tax=Suicoccus acidiformans TaxID=2036206 RepID=A0A347WI37_9LACT|nr:XRE family transcriptional regulator [Suicoccus acidiformans]AXY24744.1 multidrug transporter [Suicoccus acidiformans]